MSNNAGEKQNFYEFLTQNKISIPKIQRDYVQGRNNDRVRRNREQFIRSLIAAIREEKQKNINFIYGYRNCRGEFVPIDGQQRLTTLFLLHTYIFARAKRKSDTFYNNFSYETRYTSKRFFALLIEEIHNVCKKNVSSVELQSQDERDKMVEGDLDKISERIKNLKNFSVRWTDDPTVASALIVLDDIENEFRKDSDADFEKYADILENRSPITFMVLEIEALGKPEELYIKMNARGKQLTDFENFKADLYKKLTEFSEELERRVDLTCFKKRMDNEWLLLIWNLFDDDRAFKEADDFYRNIIHIVFSNRLVEQFSCGKISVREPSRNREVWNEKLKVVQNIMGEESNNAEMLEKFNANFNVVVNMANEKYNVKTCYIDDYLKGSKDNFYECIEDFSSVFDLLGNVFESSDEDLKKDVKQKLFGSLMTESGNMTYSEKTLLFALAKYKRRYENFSLESFCEWWKFFVKLIDNTVIDKDSLFIKAIQAIENYQGHILPEDIEQGQLAFFDKRQLAEEYLKLKLMQSNLAWKEKIWSIEKDNPYFSGEIYFSFKLICANLPELSVDEQGFQNAIQKINQEYTNIRLKEFECVWKKINAIFDGKNIRKTLDEKHLFRRAMLTYGDYSLNTNDNENDEKRFTLFFEGGKNYYNWRRMLRTEESFSIFAKFLTGFEPERTSIEAYAENKIRCYKESDGVQTKVLSQEMLFYFITRPELFDYMAQNRYMSVNKKIILFSGSTLQGQYAEIKTYILAISLGQKETYEYGQGAIGGGKDEAYLQLNDLKVEMHAEKIVFNSKIFDKIEDAKSEIKRYLLEHWL